MYTTENGNLVTNTTDEDEEMQTIQEELTNSKHSEEALTTYSGGTVVSTDPNTYDGSLLTAIIVIWVFSEWLEEILLSVKDLCFTKKHDIRYQDAVSIKAKMDERYTEETPNDLHEINLHTAISDAVIPQVSESTSDIVSQYEEKLLEEDKSYQEVFPIVTGDQKEDESNRGFYDINLHPCSQLCSSVEVDERQSINVNQVKEETVNIALQYCDVSTKTAGEVYAQVLCQLACGGDVSSNLHLLHEGETNREILDRLNRTSIDNVCSPVGINNDKYNNYVDGLQGETREEFGEATHSSVEKMHTNTDFVRIPGSRVFSKRGINQTVTVKDEKNDLSLQHAYMQTTEERLHSTTYAETLLYEHNGNGENMRVVHTNYNVNVPSSPQLQKERERKKEICLSTKRSSLLDTQHEDTLRECEITDSLDLEMPMRLKRFKRFEPVWKRMSVIEHTRFSSKLLNPPVEPVPETLLVNEEVEWNLLPIELKISPPSFQQANMYFDGTEKSSDASSPKHRKSYLEKLSRYLNRETYEVELPTECHKSKSSSPETIVLKIFRPSEGVLFDRKGKDTHDFSEDNMLATDGEKNQLLEMSRQCPKYEHMLFSKSKMVVNPKAVFSIRGNDKRLTSTLLKWVGSIQKKNITADRKITLLEQVNSFFSKLKHRQQSTVLDRKKMLSQIVKRFFDCLPHTMLVSCSDIVEASRSPVDIPCALPKQQVTVYMMHAQYQFAKNSRDPQKRISTTDSQPYNRINNVNRDVSRNCTFQPVHESDVVRKDTRKKILQSTKHFFDHLQKTVLQTCSDLYDISHNLPKQQITVYMLRSQYQFPRDPQITLSTADGQVYSKEMCREIDRYGTFEAWPRTAAAWPNRLAAAGYYYRGQGDEVVCYSCGNSYSGWRAGMAPMEIHRSLSPTCSFITHQAVNIPVVEDEQAKVRLMQINGFSPAPSLVYQSSGYYSMPQQTHQEPKETRQRPTTSLAPSATPADVPVFPSLPTPQKPATATPSGQPFMSANVTKPSIPPPRPQPAVQPAQSTSSVPKQSSPSTPRAGAIQSDFSGTLGISTDRPQYPNYAVTAIRMNTYNNGWPHSHTQTPKDLAEAGFFYSGHGDSVRCFFCGTGLRNWDTGDNPWVEHARWSPHCVYLNQHQGSAFVSLVQELSSGGNQVNYQQVRTILQDIPGAKSAPNQAAEQQGVVDLEDVSRTNSAENSKLSIIPDQDDSLAEENERLKQQTVCKICLDKEVTIVFLPCGHLCCCAECAPALRKCPMCRADVKGTVRAYMG